LVYPQPDGDIDVDDWLGPLAEKIASLNLAGLYRAGGRSIDMKLNWKLANDIFVDTCHFPKVTQKYFTENFLWQQSSPQEIWSPASVG
jgi:phenylpropionate dioxygenase-like ring-hydroxylating dioxygenase large terminal subunit